MAEGRVGSAIRRMLRLVSARQSSGLSDSELLERFARQRDEAAFETLLWRHGTMVLNTCQRILRHSHDAEDAFQATFLVLARKAGSIRRREAVGAWLYRVAFRIARRVRARSGRGVGQVSAESLPAPESGREGIGFELRSVLDQELNRLPEKYRAPLVLHYLEGKTIEQTAQELCWPAGTVSGRLARGKELLRGRLGRRGVTLTTAAVAGGLAGEAGADTLPPALLQATVKVALAFAAGRAAALGAGGPAAALAEGTLRTLALIRLSIVAVVFLALGVMAVGAGAIFHSLEMGYRAGDARAAGTPDRASIEARTDAFGDPLPDRARLRLGTVRFRPGNMSVPTALAYSPDGRLLASVGGSGRIRLWDAATGEPRGTLRHDPQTTLFALAFSPDGQALAAGGSDARSGDPLGRPSSVTVWDLATRLPTHTFVVPAIIYAIAFPPVGGHVAAAGYAEFIALWDLTTGKETGHLPTDGHPVRALAFSPDGQTLAVGGSDDSAVHLWDVARGKERLRLKAGGGKVVALAFALDGRALACGSEGKEIGIWDPETGKAIRTWTGFLGGGPQKASPGVVSMALARDGSLLAGSGYDATIRLWETATGRQRACLPYRDWVWLAFSPDAKTLAALGTGQIRLWESAAGRRIRVTDAPDLGPMAAALSPDGKTVATPSREQALTLWETRTGQRIGTIGSHPSCRWAAFSPDGSLLASGLAEDGKVRLWQVATGQERHAFPEADVAAFSPDGQFLATANAGAIRLWDVAQGRQIRETRDRYASITPRTLAFSADGKLLAWVSRRGPHGTWLPEGGGKHFFALWETAGDSEAPRYIPCPDLCWGVAFSPDGQFLATAGAGDIHLWKLGSWQRPWQLMEADQFPKWRRGFPLFRPVTFSPDGRLLAAPTPDDTIVLWDLATRKVCLTLPGHEAEIQSLAFAADGRTLISSSYDQTVLFWDVTR